MTRKDDPISRRRERERKRERERRGRGPREREGRRDGGRGRRIRGIGGVSDPRMRAGAFETRRAFSRRRHRRRCECELKARESVVHGRSRDTHTLSS